VLVLRVLEARGIRFQAVAVLGLSEGIFPEVEREDPFLNEAIRESIGLDPRLGRDQGGLFYQAVTRADQFLLLTRPYLAEDGSSWEPSPFWTAADDLFVDVVKRVRPDEPRALKDAASPEELLFWSIRKRKLPAWAKELAPRWKSLQSANEIVRARQARMAGGPFEGNLDSIQGHFSQVYGSDHVWSASRLESYAQCPMFFLTSSAMKLDPRDPPEPGYDPAQLGLILHAILEKVYPAAPDPASTDSVLSVLPGIAEEMFTDAPEEYRFQPTALWVWEREELLETLEETIAALGEVSHGWTPYAYEQKFGIGDSRPVEIELKGETVLARGIIDRVDRNKDGELRIIDYKTGSSHLGRDDLIRGRRLQLAIYALGARDALGLGEPVEGFYWMIRAAKSGSLKLSKFKHTSNSDAWLGPEGAMEVARMHIQEVVSRIRAGQFMPAAPDGGCPSYCPAVEWCWRYQAGWW
jgi:ATP-dependent helicase/DNAse subunit B